MRFEFETPRRSTRASTISAPFSSSPLFIVHSSLFTLHLTPGYLALPTKKAHRQTTVGCFWIGKGCYRRAVWLALVRACWLLGTPSRESNIGPARSVQRVIKAIQRNSMFTSLGRMERILGRGEGCNRRAGGRLGKD